MASPSDDIGNGTFEQRLPNVPQGEYELFADVVHASGISETVTGRLDHYGDSRARR